MKFATFSIVAHDAATESFGVAVASKFLAVGAYVPFAKAGVGAIATQALANLTFGPNGLAHLAASMSAQPTLASLLAADEKREHRQVGIIDALGNAATYTGNKCMSWAGGLIGKTYAAQGNILAGPHVVQAMAAAYENVQGDLADRLYAALQAGDLSGGDRRGKQSAALLVVKPSGGYQGFNDRYIDLRVDDHADPVGELATLLRLHRLYFGETPTSAKLKLTPDLVRELQRSAQRAGAYTAALDGVLSEAARQQLENFIGCENLEERIDLAGGTIDPPALEYLRSRFA